MLVVFVEKYVSGLGVAGIINVESKVETQVLITALSLR